MPTADGSTTEALTGDTWIIPAARMKEEGNREHRVPLVPEMLALLGDRSDPNDLLFGAMHDRTMLWLLRSLRPGVTVHGFRSVLTDWIRKQGCFNEDLRETALALVPPNATTQAYARDELCEERRPMTEAYADFATG